MKDDSQFKIITQVGVVLMKGKKKRQWMNECM